MKQKKNRYIAILFFLILPLLLLAVLFYIESSPYKIASSSVFSSAEQTETRLYVIMNTLLPVQEEELAGQVIDFHLRQNGPREKATYELRLFRTEVHYQFHIEYDVIFCDESGQIL